MVSLFSIRKPLNTKLIFFVLFLSLFLFTLYYGARAIRVNSPNSTSVTGSMASKVVSLSSEEKQKSFEKWSSEMLFFSSIEEASNEVGFTIKEPRRLSLKKKLKGVYVTPDINKEEREAYLIYGEAPNLLVIFQRKANLPLNYDALYQEMLEWKEEGYAKNDALPELIKVKGVKALVIQPGFNFINGKKIPRPGSVDFTKGGVQYVIVGQSGENPTSRSELVEIAGSLWDF